MADLAQLGERQTEVDFSQEIWRSCVRSTEFAYFNFFVKWRVIPLKQGSLLFYDDLYLFVSVRMQKINVCQFYEIIQDLFSNYKLKITEKQEPNFQLEQVLFGNTHYRSIVSL